ncbi:hypothetical protein FRB90_005553 [Tulasnella sp. 427]|nr:hypothetical protein FRB90_005553 [Tulasnella sp. 427]
MLRRVLIMDVSFLGQKFEQGGRTSQSPQYLLNSDKISSAVGDRGNGTNLKSRVLASISYAYDRARASHLDSLHLSPRRQPPAPYATIHGSHSTHQEAIPTSLSFDYNPLSITNRRLTDVSPPAPPQTDLRLSPPAGVTPPFSRLNTDHAATRHVVHLHLPRCDAIGNSPYRHFSLWDGWMERSWSVYALDGGEDVIKSAAAGGLKRAGSLSASSASSSGADEPTGKWYSGAGIVGSSERRAIKNEEVRNALTTAFLQTIARSLPSTEIII